MEHFPQTSYATGTTALITSIPSGASIPAGCAPWGRGLRNVGGSGAPGPAPGPAPSPPDPPAPSPPGPPAPSPPGPRAPGPRPPAHLPPPALFPAAPPRDAPRKARREGEAARPGLCGTSLGDSGLRAALSLRSWEWTLVPTLLAGAPSAERALPPGAGVPGSSLGFQEPISLSRLTPSLPSSAVRGRQDAGGCAPQRRLQTLRLREKSRRPGLVLTSPGESGFRPTRLRSSREASGSARRPIASPPLSARHTRPREGAGLRRRSFVRDPLGPPEPRGPEGGRRCALRPPAARPVGWPGEGPPASSLGRLGLSSLGATRAARAWRGDG